MFNPEKLLGGLIRSTTRGSRGGLGGLLSGGAALGILGVAMEAVEHYMNKPPSAASPPMAGSAPPPTPSMGGGPLPPPPPLSGKPSSVPPPPPAASQPIEKSEAVLLIRAMIAAANADGLIDQSERNNILQRLQSVALSPEEQTFIVQELLAPVELAVIVDGVGTPEQAERVYTVSLMAIDVDTEQERRYLSTLADRLGLDSATVERLHRNLAHE
jgi:uncharacterized membrane protein YebE (DUF533 family)